MPQETPSANQDDQFFTAVSDEQYDELSQLNGSRVVFAAVWEESLIEALDNEPSDDVQAADIDLYLEQGVYFECYGVVCYPSLEGEPLASLAEIEQSLKRGIDGGLWLEEIAVDEDDSLVLVLARRHQPQFYLQVGAWLLEEWEELPDPADS